jgi:hopene-associated glycosyltransferase HpnB
VPSVILAVLSLAIWLYLLFARGQFWRLRRFDDDLAPHTLLRQWPSVVAIVPARNEAETIAQAIGSLLQQDYPGEFSVILIDDHSEDATAQLARQAAQHLHATDRLAIHSASPLPPGWTGKLWALGQGTAFVHPDKRRAVPESGQKVGALAPADRYTYLWFTDADITHAPDTLRRLVSRAEQHQLDLTSLMVLLQAKTLPERVTIPAFLFFFLKLYPPNWIAASSARTAGAAGGCILLRLEALDRIGGLTVIRSEVIDDCALARAVKRTGGRIWMGLTRQSVSLRAYRTLAGPRDMIARTAFTQLHYSAAYLLAALTGLILTYMTPIALLFAHNAATRAVALVAWLILSLLFLPTIRFYRLSPLWAPLLPLTACFYAYATTLSAARYYLHRGAQWKGRSQAPQQDTQ